MPNWCFNQLTIPKGVAEKCLLRVTEDPEGRPIQVVDFNILRPMPESLMVTSGSSNLIDIYLYLSNKLERDTEYVVDLPEAHDLFASPSEVSRIREEIDKALIEDPDLIEKGYPAGKQLVQNYLQYGAITWYEWRSENWGTKWEASETKVIPNEQDPGLYDILFLTANNPPMRIMEDLSHICDYKLSYSVEGNGYGELSVKDGIPAHQYHRGEDPDGVYALDDEEPEEDLD